MESSKFQFVNPRLIGFEFTINKEFKATNEAVNIGLAFNVDIKRSANENEAIVELTVEVGSREADAPFFICATEGAKFCWSENLTVGVDELLKQNAPALLIGYLRPLIASITAASPFNTYNIPFIDFSKV